jgi:AAA+ superfamily predicted ATPase
LIRSIKQHIAPVQPLQAVLDGLRSLVIERIESQANGVSFDLKDWISDDRNQQVFKYKASQNITALSDEDWLVVLLTLVPHLQPSFFESIIYEHFPNGGDLPEFGGTKGTNHRGMLPTGETIQFILAGNDLQKRLHIQELFLEGHTFFQQGILWLEPVREGEPLMSGRIILSQEWIEKLLFSKEWVPRFGLDFPAKHITTHMLWDDVVLHPQTLQQVNDISSWLKHHAKLNEDENFSRKIKPGYRVLFYGPSGTGKTLTAALLGKQFNKDVYRIDLSQIVSKFIGETEKNLENVFKKAETKDWILFFDEADALFGKRTNVQSAHDKYANQEVSYLLQRVEDYKGLLILASNFKNNLDDAFIRRFHAVIHFPMPNQKERYTLWQKSMPKRLKTDSSVNLMELSSKYELSGASILNAVYFSALQCYSRSSDTLTQTDLINGIKKEFLKEEKSI